MKYVIMTHSVPLKASDRQKFVLKKQMTDGGCPHKSAVDILQATQQWTEATQCRCQGIYWCHLANMTAPSMCSGDAALYQITLTTCYYHYFHMVVKFNHLTVNRSAT